MVLGRCLQLLIQPRRAGDRDGPEEYQPRLVAPVLPDFVETVELIGDVDAIRPQPLVNQMGGGNGLYQRNVRAASQRTANLFRHISRGRRRSHHWEMLSRSMKESRLCSRPLIQKAWLCSNRSSNGRRCRVAVKS